MGCKASTAVAPTPLVSILKEIIREDMPITEFEIQRTIGSGGFGDVMAAILTANKKWYAVKRMDKTKVASSAAGVSNLFYERDLLLKLHSKWLVNAYVTIQDEWYVYMVMDLCLGGDLRYHLSNDRRFTEMRTRMYVAQILLGLNYLHEQNILHRDIKPDNILLDERGYVKVTDVGLAATMVNGRCTKKSGTGPYMSPEMLAGDHGVCADYFAVGVTALELISGTRQEVYKKAHPTVNTLEKTMVSTLLELPGVECSEAGKQFINSILLPDEKFRLGFKGGLEEIKAHRWFEGFDWNTLETNEMVAEFIPNIMKANCKENTEEVMAALDMGGYEEEAKPDVKPEDQKIFVSYNALTQHKHLIPFSGCDVPVPPSVVARLSKAASELSLRVRSSFVRGPRSSAGTAGGSIGESSVHNSTSKLVSHNSNMSLMSPDAAGRKTIDPVRPRELRQIKTANIDEMLRVAEFDEEEEDARRLASPT